MESFDPEQENSLQKVMGLLQYKYTNKALLG